MLLADIPRVYYGSCTALKVLLVADRGTFVLQPIWREYGAS